MRVFAFSFLCACGAAQAPLRLHAMSPATIGASAGAALKIEGQGFEPLVTVDLDNRGSAASGGAFAAALINASDEVALRSVVFASTTELKAVAPIDLAPGTYTLQVTTPEGAMVTLANALEVTP